MGIFEQLKIIDQITDIDDFKNLLNQTSNP